MSRYLLQKSDTRPYGWVLTDTELGIVQQFDEGNYNDSQKTTILEDSLIDAPTIAEALRKMSEWLRDNHYEIIFSSPQRIKAAARRGIGDKLRELREQRGYSLRYLAKLTGFSYDNISRIEHGRYNVTVDNLALLADALGVKLSLNILRDSAGI